MRSPKASTMMSPILPMTSMPTSSMSEHRSDRESPVDHCLVDRLDRGTLLDEVHRPRPPEGTRIRRGVEAGAVVDDDHGLALPLAERDGGGQCPVGRLLGSDDLEQRHLLHRREVVHAEHGLGPGRCRRDVADRNRRGVRGEDRVFLGDGLDLAQQRLLELEALEDGLDHQVDVAEPGPVGGAGDPVHRLVRPRTGRMRRRFTCPSRTLRT